MGEGRSPHLSIFGEVDLVRKKERRRGHSGEEGGRAI
jgi:hypothetical protein